MDYATYHLVREPKTTIDLMGNLWFSTMNGVSLVIRETTEVVSSKNQLTLVLFRVEKIGPIPPKILV